VQEHLKIRLTGACILVIVVVALVPEMFRGQPEGRAAHGEAVPGELPVHRVNIDLRNDRAVPNVAAPSPGPAATLPGNAGTMPGAAASAPAAAPQPASAAPGATAAQGGQVGQGSQGSQSAPIAIQQPPQARTPSAPGQANSVAAPPVSAAAEPSGATPAAVQAPVKPVAAAHANGRWAVQVGTFSRRDFAERMVKQLRAKGFTVVAAGPDDRGLYRVRSAIMNSRASADALRQKMLQKGLKPIVNAAP